MREESITAMISKLKETAGRLERRLFQMMDVIDAKDAIIECQLKEIAQLKAEIAELKGIKSLWNEVEE